MPKFTCTNEECDYSTCVLMGMDLVDERCPRCSAEVVSLDDIDEQRAVFFSKGVLSQKGVVEVSKPKPVEDPRPKLFEAPKPKPSKLRDLPKSNFLQVPQYTQEFLRDRMPREDELPRELRLLRDFQNKMSNGQYTLAALEGFDILFVASKSAGTGEVTAALNALAWMKKHLPEQRVTVQYGGDGNSDDEARDEMRKLVRAPAGKDWVFDKDLVRYVCSGALDHRGRPVLVLAPHMYNDREREFSDDLPAGSVVASWAPFGWSNGDIECLGLAAVEVPARCKMGYRDLGQVLRGRGKKLVYEQPWLNVPPVVAAFNPSDGDVEVGSSEALIRLAFAERAKNKDNGLACIYGHGTNSNADEVLLRLLKSVAAKGSWSDKWAIVVVIHHVTFEDENKRKLASPQHLQAAIKATKWKWDETAGANKSSGVYTCNSYRIKVYHMKGVSKSWMDGLFQLADLPITEGANTIHQLMAGGRPLLRVAGRDIGKTYLGSPTGMVEAWAKGKKPLEAALAALRSASLYLSGFVEKEPAPIDVIRNLMFRKKREGVDALAQRLQEMVVAPENNPFVQIISWLFKEHLVPDGQGGHGFTLHED